jgi:hypothetical protein
MGMHHLIIPLPLLSCRFLWLYHLLASRLKSHKITIKKSNSVLFFHICVDIMSMASVVRIS